MRKYVPLVLTFKYVPININSLLKYVPIIDYLFMKWVGNVFFEFVTKFKKNVT